MPDRTYVIEIRNTAGEQGAGSRVGGAGAGAGKADQQTEEPSPSPDKGEVLGAILQKAIGKLTVYGTTRQVLDSVVSHKLSQVEILTGSREAQERATYLYNTIGSFVDSAVNGAIMGASIGGAGAGAYGAAIGAVVGVVKAGVSYGINYAKATDNLNKQRAVENVSRDLVAQRITISGSRYMNARQM